MAAVAGLSPGEEELDRRAEERGNTLRILVATDCHLGYLEKDEERGFDSFDTFEEICRFAVKNNVDFLLLGGDLFHENNPSCSTFVKTVEILRRYCINDRPVQFQVVSDQAASLQNRSGQVNYEDPNYNVGLPVFTIHGNNDDPTGAENMSASDILSAGNFLNYFGKMNLGSSGVGTISVSPILIRKAETFVALYGLGNIRDERLKCMLQEPRAVNWMQPESRDAIPLCDWFNILILHQNRTKASPDRSISEHLLPRFLDLVIWGHEHECLIDPQEVPGMGFHISQPGSTIATSLTSAEAKSKHVLLLAIKGRQYRSTKIPLKSVRPFLYTEVILEDEVDIDPTDETTVNAHLHKVVNHLITKTRAAAGGSESKLPLVRIKVTYSGTFTINPKQFGQKYVGKVANPQDIFALSRSVRRRQSMQEHAEDSEELGPISEINELTIEALIEESNLKMQILPVRDLNCALHEFVDRDDKMAFHSCLQNKLATSTMDSIKIDEETIEDELDRYIKAQGKETIAKGGGGSQNQLTDTLGAFEELRNSSLDEPGALDESDDDIVECSDPEESCQRAGQKRRAAAGGGGGSAGRRKTDLASFTAPAKEDGAGATKKTRPRVAPGRYGAVIRRTT